MKNWRTMNIRSILFLLGALFLFACGGNDVDVDCEDVNAVNSLSTSAFQTINAAITAFNNSEQTDADCQILKDDYEEFIDTLEALGDCGVDVATNLQNARTDQSGLPCN